MSQIAPLPEACPCWSIAEIERDTGLGKDALRAWERRYGFPQPLRDARGDRLYDQQTLDRLLLIKRLLDAGHRPGQVARLPVETLQALLQDRRGTTGQADMASSGLSCWLDLLARSSPAELRAALREPLQRLGLAQAIENLLAPLGRELGQAWLGGQLPIHQEHLFSEALHTVLRESISALESDSNPASTAPRVLLTTLPKELHQLGLLMAECYFALERCERITLGINTPLPEILASAGHYRADIVALSISPHAATRVVREQLARLREQLPVAMELWVGGGWTEAARRQLPAGVQRVSSSEQVRAGLTRWRATHNRNDPSPAP